MATQWPVVKARLVALLPTLAGWDAVKVFNGKPVTDAKPAQYVTVGYATAENVGTFSTTQSEDGFRRGETGLIISRLVCNSGSTKQAANEAAAFALMDALDAYIRSDRRLGNTLSPEGTADLVVDVEAASNRQGTGIALVFTLTYYTVT